MAEIPNLSEWFGCVILSVIRLISWNCGLLTRALRRLLRLLRGPVGLSVPNSRNLPSFGQKFANLPSPLNTDIVCERPPIGG